MTRVRRFACSEADCFFKPFSNRAGLLRHQREVHGLQNRDKPNGNHQCPQVDCKRHRIGFARESNLQAHIKRIHDKYHKDSQYVFSAAASSCSEPIVQAEICPTVTGQSTNVELCAAGSDPTLDGLRFQIEKLRTQRTEALREFDKSIETLSRALCVMERASRDV